MGQSTILQNLRRVHSRTSGEGMCTIDGCGELLKGTIRFVCPSRSYNDCNYLKKYVTPTEFKKQKGQIQCDECWGVMELNAFAPCVVPADADLPFLSAISLRSSASTECEFLNY